jgi:hypothetical protein
MNRLSGLFIPACLIAAVAACSGDTVDLGGGESQIIGGEGAKSPPVSSDGGASTQGGNVDPNVAVSIRLSAPEAGIDYPTDMPVPAELQGKKILVLDEPTPPQPDGAGLGAHIVVDGSAELEAPTAGLDYPTDVPPPTAFENAKILVLRGTERIVIGIKAGIPGTDFPTGDQSVLVWAFNPTTRIDIRNIASIVEAEAGIDFPTDAPPVDFYVVVTKTGDRHRI